MRIYLDNCSLQRPFDDQSQLRIAEESEAIVEILSAFEVEILLLISSEVLQIEIDRISDEERKEASLQILKIAAESVPMTPDVLLRAFEFREYGIESFDALHLASAEAGRAEYFCTTDDKLLKRARKLNGLKIKLVSPRELLEEILR